MIHHGDLFDVLPTLDAESIDACVTDPPYGLSFMAKDWDRGGVAFRYETWSEVVRVLKPGAHLLAFGGTRTFHRLTCAIEDAGFEIRDCLSWLYGQGFPKSLNLGDGRGTALKPSWEPIILARKPIRGTVKANEERYGTGAMNIDACRLIGIPPSVPQPLIGANPEGRTYGYKTGEGRNGAMSQSDLGRWPANVLLDEDAAAMLDEQSGESQAAAPRVGGFRSENAIKGNIDFKSGSRPTYPVVRGDAGGASRFYYVAKPSREERDYGTERLIARQRDESRKEGNPGGDNPRNRGLQPRGNFHPTVKPVELMRWLVKLVTPPDGIVLDPFMGSGTTGMACRYEHRRFIGIEREADYIQIAEARIAAVAPLFGEASV